MATQAKFSKKCFYHKDVQVIFLKEFNKGQRIKTLSGKELEVIQKLGEGGQGIVYKVKYNGKDLALKWYFGNKLNDADKFYRNIQNNIKQS